MAFSLFGKKNDETIVPVVKKAARSAAPRSSASSSSSPAPAPAASDDLSLDFTTPGAFDSLPQIDFEEASSCTHCVIEEAAMLFANGQDDATRKTLEAALSADDLGADTERGWAMLFDLYQIQGDREAFETAALNYAAHFEKSPPTWVVAAPSAVDPALATGGRAAVSLTGVLNAQSADPLKQLIKAAQSNPMVRLELSKLDEVDNLGCNLLLRTLNSLKKVKKDVVFSGAEQLIKLLKAKVESGTRENEAIWLLLLDVYQRQGTQEEFDDLAVNYAITFEVSPPSWEAPAKKPVKAEPPPVAEVQPGCALSGEIVSASMDTFSSITAAAEGCDEVAVDLSSLKRIDFVSTGQFLNALSSLQKAGKRVRLVGVNQLLAALFDIMGVSKVAEIALRKF